MALRWNNLNKDVERKEGWVLAGPWRLPRVAEALRAIRVANEVADHQAARRSHRTPHKQAWVARE